MKSYLADINVWLAISYLAHEHHPTARDWFHGLTYDRVSFTRFTQMGLLRLLTNQRVMGPRVNSQKEAWEVVDGLQGNARVDYMAEPIGTGEVFRRLTQSRLPAGRLWSDAYIGAMAIGAGMTVATFDRGFIGMGVPALILE